MAGRTMASENRRASDPLNTTHKIIKFVKPAIRPNHVTIDDGLIRTSTKGVGKVPLQKHFSNDDVTGDTKYHRNMSNVVAYVLTMDDSDEIVTGHQEINELLNSM